MMIEPSPFVFYTERRLVSLTGLNARNLPELLGALREVSGAAIFIFAWNEFLKKMRSRTLATKV